jgi:hypothetical protein
MTASVLPILADDNNGLVLHPVADTAITQVPQDGDNSVKTTLASCPSLCDGNPRGRRDATLQFAVDQLPANATEVTAKLRVYAWHNVAARILARAVPGDLGAVATPSQPAAASSVPAADRVTKGYNEFDVSGSVRQGVPQAVQHPAELPGRWLARQSGREHRFPGRLRRRLRAGLPALRRRAPKARQGPGCTAGALPPPSAVPNHRRSPIV